jgi:uncharacterized protein
MTKLLLGLLIGFVFGFLLQKGQVAKRRVILGQFLLRDFTVMKMMLTAIAVGGIGVYILKAMGLVTLHVKPLQVGAVIVGGLIFGVGMAVLGYCPGTAVAALGEGSRDARWGVIGMAVGAMVFSEVIGQLQGLLKWNDLGPLTLPEMTGLPWWLWLGVVAAAVVLIRPLPARGE